jgi:hypothetical protein
VTIINAGTIKRLHVDKQIIARNRKEGRDDPTLTIQTSKGSFKASVVLVDGPCKFIQAGPASGRKPLSCGARVWVETRAKVVYA